MSHGKGSHRPLCLTRNKPIHHSGFAVSLAEPLFPFLGGGLLTTLIPQTQRPFHLPEKLLLLHIRHSFCLMFYLSPKPCRGPASRGQTAIMAFVGLAGFRHPLSLHCLECWPSSHLFCRPQEGRCP